MIESPVLIEFAASERRKGMVNLILHLLRGRFGSVPPEMASLLQAVEDEEALKALGDLVAACPDLDSFRARLPS